MRYLRLASVPALALASATPAFAAAPDFSALTAAVDLSTVGPALMAVAGVLIGVAVVRKGIRMVLGMIGR